MALTYKQTLFVNYYLGESNGNATDAARRAGYKHPNVRSAELVVNSSIRVAIDAKLSEAAMPANEALARLSEFARGDLGAFLDINEQTGWSVNLWKAKRAGKTKLLKKVKATKEGTEIEIHSPLEALDKLAKYHGLYVEKSQVTTKHIEETVVELPMKNLHAEDQTSTGAAE